MAFTTGDDARESGVQDDGGIVSTQPRRLRFLLDTNIFIAAEPRADTDVEPGATEVAELLRRISEAGHALEVHPAGRLDIGRDRDERRRTAREVQHAKYPTLPSPPAVPDAWEAAVGWADGDNDHVDLLHLAALEAHAASFLITEDRKLHRHAAVFGLSDRVVTVAQGVSLIRTLHDPPVQPPPTVERHLAHELDPSDPIFSSLRATYVGFDDWFSKVRQERRTTFTIRAQDGLLAAISLIKDEPDGNDAALPGHVMKISTFKVSDEATGTRRGELLLKALFTEAAMRRVDGMYLTVFADAQPGLVATITQFGFRETSHSTQLGEQIFAKRLATPVGVATGTPPDSLSYHIEFGPPALHPDDGTIFIVPITPAYAARLFPDAAEQLQLIEPAPYGNALRKAYLCRAKTRQISVGDVLGFYESSSKSGVAARGLFAVGVVERVLATGDGGEVAEAVGTRTVYSMSEIQDMAQTGEILALMFRQDRVLAAEISLEELTANSALRSHPQSITSVRRQGAAWMRNRLQQ